MGRPPVQGYCLTCRRRKVKCDRVRPACKRCIKAGFNCPGYDQPLRMQHHVVGQLGGLVRAPGSISAIARRHVPQTLSLIGFQDQISFSFYFHAYRWAYFWRAIVRSAPIGNGDLHYVASSAVAVGYLAKIKKNSELETKATELSLHTIAAIQSTISQGSKSDVAGLLSVLAALGIYNYTVDEKFHYLHHYGTLMVLKFCGPASFQTEPYLTAFRRSRMMLSCCALSFRCRIFLSDEEWKLTPFLYDLKSMEDRIMDIFVDIPGLTERIAMSRRSLQDTSDLKGAIATMRARLSTWWIQWWALNGACATEKDFTLPEGGSIPKYVASFLSTGLCFQTAQQALELMCYHSAMLFLGQLESVLAGVSPELDIPRSITSYSAACGSRVLRLQTDTPLLLPEEIEHSWQHGLEGLRVLNGFCMAVSSSAEVYLTFAPMAILYCFSEHLGIRHVMVSMISTETWVEEAEEELGSFRLCDLACSSRGVNCGFEPRRREPQDYSIQDARQMFIQSARS